jgi:(R,R)-butanediol dehydrogenase/meso-butanediol dehydrogenase/diacetyl reductase
MISSFGSAFTAVSVRRPGARADAAGRLGADAVIDSSSTDVVEAIMEMTKGRGVDVVFETSGAPEAMTTAIGAVRMGGTIVSLAVWLAPAPCDYMQLLLKELTIVGSKGYNKPDFPEAIAAIGDGRIRGAQEIITTRIGLDEAISGGFEVLADDRSSHVKILVSP